MAYSYGAQGVQYGPQGPQLYSGVLWGNQGPVSGKEQPYYGWVGSGSAISSVRLDLHYTMTNGNKFVVTISRTPSSQADLLNNLPDDLVRMINISDFRPHSGYYYTALGGQAKYRVLETTDFVDPINALLTVSDPSEEIYTANETGV